MEHTPPPRSGDWSSVNRHLTAGGTVEGIPRGNPYRAYYLSLIKKAPTVSEGDGYIEPASTIDEKVVGQELGSPDDTEVACLYSTGMK